MKEIKKDYIVRVYQDGEIINEVKLKNSKKKILVHKYNSNELKPSVVHKMHQSLQSLHPKLQVLLIPRSSEIEIYEIR